MKVRSITNVITNSSSEVFILNTSDLNSVKEFLKEIPGCGIPEITKIGDNGNLDWLLDFGSLYDLNDPNSKHNYLTKIIPVMKIWNYDDSCKLRKIGCENNKFIKHAWIEFCRKNIQELNNEILSNFCWAKPIKIKYLKERNYNKYEDNLYPDIGCENFIIKFYDYFIKTYPGKVPKSWKSIPEELTAQYWEGKVGFCSIDENTINYEDYDKILDKFEGNHWHMG